MIDQKTDYRYSQPYGWDSSKPIPKVKDLVVVTSNRTNQKNAVMRLVEDLPERQTIEVTDDLVQGLGFHARLARRDIRALSAGDEVVVVAG